MLAIAERCLHNTKAASVSHSTLQWVAWEWVRGWETADPKSLEGWSMPHSIMLGNKTRGQFFQGRCCSGTAWASVWWWEVVSDFLCISWGGSVCLFVLFLLLFIKCLYWPMRVFMLIFALPIAFPFLLGGSKWAAGVCLLAGWSQLTTSMKLALNFHLTDWQLKVDHLEEVFLKVLKARTGRIFLYLYFVSKSGLFQGKEWMINS